MRKEAPSEKHCQTALGLAQRHMDRCLVCSNRQTVQEGPIRFSMDNPAGSYQGCGQCWVGFGKSKNISNFLTSQTFGRRKWIYLLQNLISFSWENIFEIGSFPFMKFSILQNCSSTTVKRSQKHPISYTAIKCSYLCHILSHLSASLQIKRTNDEGQFQLLT